MDIFSIIFGAAAGLVGGSALFTGVRRRAQPLATRLLLLGFGAAFATYGVLHFAEGIGQRWATPGLRSGLYLWFAIPCFVAWLFVWFAERRRDRR